MADVTAVQRAVSLTEIKERIARVELCLSIDEALDVLGALGRRTGGYDLDTYSALWTELENAGLPYAIMSAAGDKMQFSPTIPNDPCPW